MKVFSAVFYKKKLLIPAMVLLLAALASMTVFADSQTITIDTGGSVTITDAGKDYIITQADPGTATANTITVNVGTGSTVNITVNNINIVSTGCAFNIVSGSVNLTLEGTNTLQSGDNYAGLQNGVNPLVITAASAGTLTANGGYCGAGIGGGREIAGGNITVGGGTVTATGGDFAAGIGGGYAGTGSDITVSGGTVQATSVNYGAGIGSGSGAAANDITVSGGSVTAAGGSRGAGIGGGQNGAGNNITVSGGTAAATGGSYAAGIGGGYYGAGSNIVIGGGSVKVTAGYRANAIGGGYSQNAVTPTNSQGQEVYSVTRASLSAQELGWLAEQTGGVPYYNMAGANPIDGTYYLYLPRYAVTYNLNLTGATNPNTTPVTFSVLDSVTLALLNAEPNNPAYQFLRWEDTAGNPAVTIPEGNKADVLLKARWLNTNILDTGGPVTITDTSNDYRITQADSDTATANTITVDIGAGNIVNMTIDNINIVTTACAFNIVSGSVNLTLEGANTLQSGTNYAGLQNRTNPLTVTAVSTGTLTARGGDHAAGIGGGREMAGGNITICGGTVRASSPSYGAGIGGGYLGSGSNIVISGGLVTATGGVYAAGIGGGSGRGGSNITVSGGDVTATGGYNGAGIGGGSARGGSNLTLSGGTVKATGGAGGAGIGGGYNGAGSNIVIGGGSVKAVAGSFANAIGGGERQSAVTPKNAAGQFVYLVTKTSLSAQELAWLAEQTGGAPNYNMEGANPIDGSYYLYLPGYSITYTMNLAGAASTNPSFYFSSLFGVIQGEITLTDAVPNNTDYAFRCWLDEGGNAVSSIPEGSTGNRVFSAQWVKTTIYLDTDGPAAVTNSAYDYVITQTDSGTATANTVTVDTGAGSTVNITIRNINVVSTGCAFNILSGAVNLTLEGTNTLQSGENYAGLQNGLNPLTVMAGSTGELAATGGKYAAGVGGGNTGAGSNITIDGGMVNATGGAAGAGIGGGYKGAGSNITVLNGTVAATGGSCPGIGGGVMGTGSNITVSGGDVTANGSSTGAGINGSGGDVTVSGGDVTASGISGKNVTVTGGVVIATKAISGVQINISGGDVTASGIYGNGSVIVSGGSVTATGGNDAAGIGGGTITVSGGDVTATGGYCGAGIGGSAGQAGSNITISGGTVNATGGEGGAGIGGGSGRGGSNITVSGGSVIAAGGAYAAGIGGGGGAGGSNITVSGGTVTATGGLAGAGIGGGLNGEGSSIVISGGSVKATGGSYVDTGSGQMVIISDIGGGLNRSAVTPKNAQGQNVYLLTKASLTAEELAWLAEQTGGVPNYNMEGANPIDGSYYLYLPGYSITYTLNLTGAANPNPAYFFSSLFGVSQGAVPLADAVPNSQLYTFNGWYDAGGNKLTAIPEGTNSDLALTAQWVANVLITFDANGGTGGTSGYKPCGSPLTAPAVTRTGYTLTGWSPEVPATVPEADSAYTAQWAANTYTVVYDGNGSTGGSTAASTHTYDTPQTLPYGGFTKTAYTFAGWNTAADGSGTAYGDGQSVVNLTAEANGTVTLYAVWSPNALIVEKEGTSTVIDPESHMIYGLEPGINTAEFETNYICLQGSGRLEYTYLNGAFGTGTKVYVIDNETGITIDSYRILIFGDVNGDGVINAVDSDVCTLVQDWMIVWDETEDAAFYEAGDVNGDSRVDAIDADIIMAHANWVISIDQTAGRAGAN